MSSLSIRPRPLDIHKKLPIVKCVKDVDDEVRGSTYTVFGSSARNSQLLGHSAELGNGAHQSLSRNSSQEIPTPQYNVVESYEKDYSCTFVQPLSYLRSRGARTGIGDFVEYDLDNKDEDWLEEFNNERTIVTPEKFETILFKLEILDHKSRERAGVITPTFGSPIPVLLQLDDALEALQSQSISFTVLQSVYDYWKAKRERWQKPILRLLQPPPPSNDANPFNVFRRRKKAHRLHTRGMQRRENNVLSFEKLRQVRRNLGQAKTMLDALIKREEKKREVVETEVSLQQIHIKYKSEAKLTEDGITFQSFQALFSKSGSSDDDLVDSGDPMNAWSLARPAVHHLHVTVSNPMMNQTIRLKQELNRRPLQNGWLHEADPLEPVFLFVRPLEPYKLAASGIVPPQDPPTDNGSVEPPYCFHGRIGRGGRIVFDRCRATIRINGSMPCVAANSRPLPNC